VKCPAYPRYRDAGIEWLGEVPEHWDTKRAKFIFRLMNRAVRPEDEVVTAFRDGTVTLRKNRRTDGFTNSEKEIGYQGVRVGDLVIHVMDAFAGAVGVSDSDGKATPVYSVCTPASGDVCTSYYARLVRHMALSGFIASLSKGIRERSTDFRYKEFADLLLPLPPLTEQVAINAYLNRETAKIEALIAKQERLVELLNEKRRSLISRAVTKGLNPNEPMKDSGVKWLGEIPEHWVVKRLRYLCSVTTGSRNTEDSVEDGEYPFFVRSQEVERINSYSFDGEAILTAGDGAGVGKVFHHYQGKLDFHQRVYLLSNFKHITGRMLFQFFKANFYKVVLEGGAKSTVDSLRLPMFQDFTIAYSPSQDEQNEIVAHLDRESAKIDALIEKAQQAVELLREHRSALISAAVTGKIDIRRYAI
jgi:type I restriction enzyme, S subunit